VNPPLGAQQPSAHLDNPDCPVSSTEPAIEAAAKDLPHPVYAIDDDSGILVDGTSVRVVGTGRAIRFDAGRR